MQHPELFGLSNVLTGSAGEILGLCPAFHGSSFMLVFYKCLSQTFVENKLCDMKYGPGPPPQGP